MYLRRHNGSLVLESFHCVTNRVNYNLPEYTYFVLSNDFRTSPYISRALKGYVKNGIALILALQQLKANYCLCKSIYHWLIKVIHTIHQLVFVLCLVLLHHYCHYIVSKVHYKGAVSTTHGLLLCFVEYIRLQIVYHYII